MLLSIHKEKTDEINLKQVANGFCEANEERRRTFDMFCDEDFLQLKAWSVDIFLKKNNLLTLMENLFSGPKETTYLFFKFIF